MAPKRASSSKKATKKKEDTPSDDERKMTPAKSAEKLAVARSQSSGRNDLNPRTTHLEWNGVFGAGATTVLLPILVLALNTLCGGEGANSCSVSWFFDPAANGGLAPGDAFQAYWKLARAELLAAVPRVPQAAAILLAWYAFHCVFYLYFPLGERGFGLKLRSNDRGPLAYNFSAWWSMVVTYVFVGLGHFYFKWFNLGDLADLYIPLAIASILLSFSFAVLLYVASFRSTDERGLPVMLAKGGNSGYAVYDFFVGRELNPRLGDLDFKFMFELRPGLIGWTLIAVAYVVKAAESAGFAKEGGYAAPGMLPLYGAALANFWYVFEGLLYEPGNVSMMDIAYDGFGFMLCFGDLAWVPFIYALQCRFLYYHPAVARSLPPLYLAAAVAVYMAGYAAFRGANSEKDRYRKDVNDPRVAHLQTMRTARGTNLIINSWWGICRHPNYVGDWLMVVATSMFTGWGSVLPYFQVIYFAVLLIHRQIRDEDWMLAKYGAEDWNAFCKKVPWRLIPGLY
jgi:delta14-sterol reductase